MLLHHFYTTSDADIKKTAFKGVLEMPRLLRIPLFSMRRFGIVHFGMFIKFIFFAFEKFLGHKGKEFDIMPKLNILGFLFFRLVLMSEFWWFLYHG